MPVNITGYSTDLTPRLFFRQITGQFSPTFRDKELLESNSFFKAVDLICEGPIEGFVDYTGKLVSGTEILKGTYINDVPVMTTDKGVNDGQFNYRNIGIAYKNGEENQSGFYTGQTDNFYWLEDFSYTSKTLNKGIRLYNSKTLGKTTVNKFYIGSHSIQDEDVDWVGITLEIGECYNINSDGKQTGNRGTFHIWGDITGVTHRSFAERHIEPIPDDSPGRNDHNVFFQVSGISNGAYREDIFFKLKDLSGVRPRKIYVENLTKERQNFRQVFSANFATVTEITESNLSYPSSAYVGTVFSAENLGSVPTRTFDLKLKKVKVPSNYVDLGEDGDGPIQEDRHPGTWDGTFKPELEWTDNPAWILYDLITNDRYGLGEYIEEIQIDKFQLYKIAKYCDELVNTSKIGVKNKFAKERRYTCNLYIENAMEALKAVNEIASIFRGIAYFNSNQIFVSQNALKESIFTFTNSNVRDGNFSYSGAAKQARFTAVKVAYKDKDDSFLPKYEYVEDPEGIIRYGLIEKEISAVGCTSRDQALRLGRWILLTSNKEEETVSFITDKTAEYINPGDVFSVADKLRNGIKTGGRIKEIVSNNPVANQNYILLDQQLNTGDYDFTSISVLIPGQDFESDTKQFKEFAHRNGLSIGAADDGDRSAFSLIPLNSSTSTNTTLNNYIENTSSGAKILTHETEDLILKETISGSFINGGAGHKTLNDYLLDTGVLINFRNGADRINNTEKIQEGFIYILNGSGKNNQTTGFNTQDFTLITKSENDDGTYSIIGSEYDSGKFNQSDNLSTIYTTSTFDAGPTKRKRDAGDDPRIFQDVPSGQIEEQEPVFGHPLETTVDLVVKPSGFTNSQGQLRSKVVYYFHNTEENARFYTDNRGKYEIRVREVDPTYFGNLLSTSVNGDNILQSGQYIISGEQDCGSYKVLYNNNLGLSIDNKAEIGGTVNKGLSLSNYQQGTFKEDLRVVRHRIMEESSSLNLEGCTVFGNTFSNTTTGNVLSGEFELLNPQGFYELRWSESNIHGHSPEKIMFFKAEEDKTPPGPCTNFTVNKIFDNIHFNWDNPTDVDLSHARIYTGLRSNNPLPGKDEFLIKSDSNFAVFPLDQTDGRGLPVDLGDGNFHIRAVDFAGNTGVATNSSSQLSISSIGSAPELHLSGAIKVGADGTQNSNLVIFYSGNFNHDPDFKEYQIEVRPTNSTFVEKFSFPTINNCDLPACDCGVASPECSGRYDYLAQGGVTYNVRARMSDILGNVSPVAEKTFTVPLDDVPPSAPTWVTSEKNGNNIFLSWENPSDADLDRIILYSGAANNSGAAAIHNESRFNSEVIPLKNFEGQESKNYFFWLRAVDTSNNTGDFSVGNGAGPDFGQQVAVAPPSVLNPGVISFTSGIENDDSGDGSSYAFINYTIQEPVDFDKTYYKIDLSRNNTFNPLVASQIAPIEYDNPNMTASGGFNNLLANEDYFVRFRAHAKNGSYSPYQLPLAQFRPIRTPKDSSLPINPDNFFITPGPKQNFLEWNWGNGISRDIDSILIYKTGIPTGRLRQNSSQNKYCWEISDISGYFESNPESYSFKLNPSTSFIDSEIEPELFSGYGVDSLNKKQVPTESVYYHYFLKTVDRSNNTGIGFVSGVSTSPHADQNALRHGNVPHTQGYVTGGSIGDNYIESIRASKILTDRITSNTFILARPSGRVLSDDAYTQGLPDGRYSYAKGSGVYMDHLMFRIGDPSEGGQGLFWTGQRLGDETYKQPTWQSDGGHDIVPNTLEIRGNMTAGTIEIGSDPTSQFRVDDDGQLSIGDQSLNVSGFFTGEVGVSGDSLPIKMQINLDNYDPNAGSSKTAVEFQEIVTRIDNAADVGGFVEINYWYGDDQNGDPVYTQEVRGLTNGQFQYNVNPDYTAGPGQFQNFGLISANTPVLGPPQGKGIGGEQLPSRDGVQTSVPNLTGSNGALRPKSERVARRDWWRIIDVKFLVSNDGRLYAQDASINGTITANSFEPRQTIILGDEINPGDSVIRSFLFNNSTCGGVQPSGFEIRGDGRATFNDLVVRSGLISGASISAGACDSTDHFRVDSLGNISVGPSLIYDDPRNTFHVSNAGDLYAVNAVVSGTLSGSAGRIGGLEINQNFIGTVGRIGLDDPDVGLFLNKDGEFSIRNNVGNIIKYDNSNDFITLTGLRSTSLSETEVNGQGLGFYIRGNNSRETSYISNFITDSWSSSGIAKKIDTQLCGEILFPIENQTYNIISGSRINYEIYDIDHSTDGNMTIGNVLWNNTTFTTRSTQNPPFNGYTVGPNQGNDSLVITMPASVGSSTVYRFNIGLRRI